MGYEREADELFAAFASGEAIARTHAFEDWEALVDWAEYGGKAAIAEWLRSHG